MWAQVELHLRLARSLSPSLLQNRVVGGVAVQSWTRARTGSLELADPLLGSTAHLLEDCSLGLYRNPCTGLKPSARRWPSFAQALR